MKPAFIAVFATVMLLFQSNIVAQGPMIEVSETVLDFGCVQLGTAEEDIVTVKNVSTNPPTDILFKISVVGGNGFLVSDSIFGLPAGKSVDVIVRCEPVAKGDAMDELTIEVMGPIEFYHVDLIATGGASSEEKCEAIDGMLMFFDDAVNDGSLVGVGSSSKAAKRLAAMRQRLESIDFLIQNSYGNSAIAQTNTVIRRSDGESSPDDFVEGPAAAELNALLVYLKALLEE